MKEKVEPQRSPVEETRRSPPQLLEVRQLPCLPSDTRTDLAILNRGSVGEEELVGRDEVALLGSESVSASWEVGARGRTTATLTATAILEELGQRA